MLVESGRERYDRTSTELSEISQSTFGVNRHPYGAPARRLAFFGALGQAGNMVRSPCQSLGWCSKPAREAPTLSNFTSSRVNGGHSFREYCEPVAQTYREQYPDFTITWHEAGDGRDKDAGGHATYQYTCTFSAVPKT